MFYKVNWHATLLTLSMLIVVEVKTYAQHRGDRFAYGVNGHPLTQEAYIKNFDLQLRLIESIGCKFYRIDIPINSQGIAINEIKFLQLIGKALDKKINILPVFILPSEAYFSSATESNYEKGRILGGKLANKYGRYFNYYEVGNEEDNKLIIGSNVHGDNTEHYNKEKLRIFIPFLKGVCESIKEKDKSAKIIINYTWVHFGYLKLLASSNVQFDIIGSHWYSDMGDITNANSGFGNILSYLKRNFKKPVWVTEINVKNGPSINTNKIQEKWLNKNLHAMRKDKNVGAIFIYELLDQPAFLDSKSDYKNFSEAQYGLWHWKKLYSNIASKPFKNTYRLFVKNNP